MAVVALATLGRSSELETELPRHGHRIGARASSSTQLRALLTDGFVDTVFVVCTPVLIDDAVIRAADEAGVRLIGVIGSEVERRYAASLGLLELIAADATWQQVADVIDRVPDAAANAPRSGQVIAVWGPAGAPGRTSIAVSIAAELASAGCSVVLADADTHSASVAPALGLLDESPGFAAACRLAGAGGLDRTELERVGQRYLSGHGSFWVLTGIGRPSRWPELSADRVTGTLRACRDWVDYTIVDTGFSLENDEEISSDLFAPRRNAATIAALRDADQVIAVGAADPVGLSRFLRTYVDLIETIDTDRLIVVMNRVRSSAIGMNPVGQVEQTLRRFGGIRSPVLVPHELAAFDAALLSGRTLRDAAPRSRARVAVTELVESRILPPGVTAGVTAPSRRERRSLRRMESTSG